MTTIPVTLDVEALTNLEAVDATTGPLETVDVGPFDLGLGPVYYRLTAADLAIAAEHLKELADRIQVTVIEARQDALLVEQVPCDGGCGTRIDPDEDFCGSVHCARVIARDMAMAAYV